MGTSKLKVRVKITGFELEVEGTRDEVSLITSNVSSQLRTMMAPPSLLGSDKENKTEDIEAQVIDKSKKGKTKRNNSRKNSDKPEGASEIIEFTNDPEKYGTPQMEWTGIQRTLWIMYVLNKEKQISEFKVSQIVNTFNRNFKQAKIITPANITRDLGKAKMLAKPTVQENANTTPHQWFLTDEGIRIVEAFISNFKVKANGTD